MRQIFHYTSYEALALILKNRSIRFTRLDHVDDITEAQTHAGIPFGKQTFVSCWTEDEVESIPQWHMYSKGMKGVRIELPFYPFRSMDFVVPKDHPEVRVPGSMSAPLTFEESVGKTYFVVPYYFDDNFAAPVEYVADVSAEYSKAVVEEPDGESGRKVTIYNNARLARLKSEQWGFQREFRFTLNIIPRSNDPLIPLGSLALAGVDPGITYLDVPLDPAALEKLVVRTGPLCTVGARTCVEAVVSTWAPGARIEASGLEGSIRQR